jgi:hypothetical protein
MIDDSVLRRYFLGLFLLFVFVLFLFVIVQNQVMKILLLLPSLFFKRLLNFENLGHERCQRDLYFYRLVHPLNLSESPNSATSEPYQQRCLALDIFQVDIHFARYHPLNQRATSTCFTTCDVQASVSVFINRVDANSRL